MKTLKKGDQGHEVEILQNLLKHRGAQLKVDGDFGTNTEKAVIQFQNSNFDSNRHSLTPDGVVGPKTWESLMNSDEPADLPPKPNADQVTLNRIKDIHPDLRDELRTIYNEILERGVAVRFAQVFRTFEEQDKLYAKGRTTPGNIVTKVRGGGSYHNYGLAVDIVLLTDNGRDVSWDRNLDLDNDGMKDWGEIVAVFKHHGWKWGGDWTSFKDYPHFEKPFGFTTAELKARFEAGDFVAGEYVRL